MNKYIVKFKSKDKILYQHCLIQAEHPELINRKLALLYCITKFNPLMLYQEFEDELTITCEIL